MLAGAAAGCEPRDEADLPPPGACSEGARPSFCVRVPLQGPRTESRPGFRLDGVASPGDETASPPRPPEYWGAVELPYVSRVHRRTRKLWVTVTRSAVPVFGRRTLRLAGEADVDPGTVQELYVALDLMRLDRRGRRLTGEDVRAVFPVSPAEGVLPVARWESPSGGLFVPSTTWTSLDGAMGEGRIRCAWRAAGRALCHFELFVRLERGWTLPSEEGYEALGLAVYDNAGGGAMPEGMLNRVSEVGLTEASLDREQMVTLLLGEPASSRLRVASWNVAQFHGLLERCLTGVPFSDALLEELGRRIAGYDVVALQEVWSRQDAERILEAANRAREAAGEPPMRLYGPPDFSPALLNEVRRSVGSPGTILANGIRVLLDRLGNMLFGGVWNETHGGVFVFSSLEPLGSGTMVYEACRGEDCLKAKGAVWVRLKVPSERPPCREDSQPGEGCGVPPSADQYVDVFATHLQAVGPEVCGAVGVIDWALQFVSFYVLSGVVQTLRDIDGMGMNCHVPTGAVQLAQLRQLADFIASRRGPEGRHPALLLGDLNVDGRRLNVGSRIEDIAWWETFPEPPPPDPFGEDRYGAMLAVLGLLPDAEARRDPAPSDLSNGMPEVFAWDVDHADVAREQFEDAWWNACGVGTAIGMGGTKLGLVQACGSARSGGLPPEAILAPEPQREEAVCRRGPWSEACMALREGREWPLPEGCAAMHYACDRPGDERLDYVLLYQGGAPGTSREPPGYLVSRPLEGPLWATPFPEGYTDPALSCGDVPGDLGLGRLSDHRLVEANLRIARLRYPGRFHPAWPMSVRVQVASLDGSGLTDCLGDLCGPIDPQMVLGSSERRVGLEEWGSWETTVGGVCHDTATVAEGDGCAADWQVALRVEPGASRGHRVRFMVLEKDVTSADDVYAAVTPPRDMVLEFDWDSASFLITNENGDIVDGWPRVPRGWGPPAPVWMSWLTLDPIGWCGEGDVRLCVRAEPVEGEVGPPPSSVEPAP